jgi:two-component system, sensor histidine kinase
LRNLVSNAVRYTHRGRIVIGARRRGAAVAVQVVDTGRGIRSTSRSVCFKSIINLAILTAIRPRDSGLALQSSGD